MMLSDAPPPLLISFIFAAYVSKSPSPTVTPFASIADLIDAFAFSSLVISDDILAIIQSYHFILSRAAPQQPMHL